jgi:hypothetical protein
MIQRRDAHFPIGSTLACLMLLILFSTGLIAQNPGRAKGSIEGSPMRATHVLGLEGLSKNVNGNLSIEGDALHFQKDKGPAAQISMSSIQDVFLGEQDKQVGGVPMALGQAATPFGGGRVIALFSHKKYDTVTVEYLDSNGGLRGVILQLNKGQGQVFRNKLVAEGAHVTDPEHQAAKQRTSETRNERK